MYKIIGTLTGGYYNEEYGNYVQVTKTCYTKFSFILKIKVFIMRIFYDYVEVEEI